MGCPSSGVLAGVLPARLTSARGVRRRPGRPRWRPVDQGTGEPTGASRYRSCGLRGGGGRGRDPLPVVRTDGGRERASSPPTPFGPGLCPPPERGSAPDRSGRPGRGAPEVTLPPWRLPWVLIR